MQKESKSLLPKQLILPALILFVAVTAVIVALFQSGRGPLAPTAPQSLPQAASSESATCAVDFLVQNNTALTCTKRAFRNELTNTPGNYTLSRVVQTVRQGDMIVWVIEAQNNSNTPTQIRFEDEFGSAAAFMRFEDSNCGTGAFDSVTQTLTCPNIFIGPNTTGSRRVEFRVTILNSAPIGTTIANSATVTDQNNESISSVCQASIVVAEETEARICNESCETDKECEDGLTCDDTTLTCQPIDGSACLSPTPTFSLTPTSSATPTFTSTPSPTNTITASPTFTLAPTLSFTPTPTSILSLTPTNTIIASLTPSNTPVYTATATSIDTADLELTKTASTTTPRIGEEITFTISVVNRGPANTQEVSVLERLPNGLQFVSATPSQGSYNPNTSIWYIGNLNVNQTVTLTLRVRVNTTTGVSNVAEVITSSKIDPDSTPNNNRSEEDDQDEVRLNSMLAVCNESCSSNADCEDTNQICYTTSEGNRCRLASNVESGTCSPAAPGLPRSGATQSQTTIIIIATAVVVLILGAVGLLLLM